MGEADSKRISKNILRSVSRVVSAGNIINNDESKEGRSRGGSLLVPEWSEKAP